MPDSDKISQRKCAQQKLEQKMLSEFFDKEAASLAATGIILSSALWSAASTVLLFASTENEPETLLIAQSARETVKKTVYPRTLNAHGDMELRFVTKADQLQAGRWNIPEPIPEECPLCPISQIDLAFIPGLAFDRRGYRIGHGGGYYDRLLDNPSFTAVKIGYFFQIQEMPKLHIEPHDQKLDWILTERELFKVS